MTRPKYKQLYLEEKRKYKSTRDSMLKLMDSFKNELCLDLKFQIDISDKYVDTLFLTISPLYNNNTYSLCITGDKDSFNIFKPKTLEEFREAIWKNELNKLIESYDKYFKKEEV